MSKKLGITFLSVAAFAVGCKQSVEKSPAETSVRAAAEKIESKTKGAAQATRGLTPAKRDYAYAQKAGFVTEKQMRLAEINRDLDILSAKVESSSDATKTDAKPKLQSLRDLSASLNKQLDDAKDATESTWNRVKAGSSKTYDELAEDFQHARQWASDRIAP